MGMGKWLARKGNVGSTARTVALFYSKTISLDPNASVQQIKSEFIDFRYSQMSDDIFAHAAVTQYASLIPGLSGLVVAVLSHEAGYLNNSPENQQLFMDIIFEELENNGVPEQLVMSEPDVMKKSA